MKARRKLRSGGLCTLEAAFCTLEAAVHGGGQLSPRRSRRRGQRPTSTRPNTKGISKAQRPAEGLSSRYRCARPARPAPPTHSRELLDAQPDREPLAPATVLTLPRTPCACVAQATGRFRFSCASWASSCRGQATPPGARCWCLLSAFNRTPVETGWVLLLSRTQV